MCLYILTQSQIDAISFKNAQEMAHVLHKRKEVRARLKREDNKGRTNGQCFIIIQNGCRQRPCSETARCISGHIDYAITQTELILPPPQTT